MNEMRLCIFDFHSHVKQRHRNWFKSANLQDLPLQLSIMSACQVFMSTCQEYHE